LAPIDMLRDCSNVALYTLLLGHMARSLAHSSTGMRDALSSSLRLRRGVERRCLLNTAAGHTLALERFFNGCVRWKCEGWDV
jgi:hypothetical protein